MLSYEWVTTKACKHCGGPFETKGRTALYCDPCKPIMRQASLERAAQKSREKSSPAPLPSS